MIINGPAHGAVSRSYLVSCPGVAQKKIVPGSQWLLFPVCNSCFMPKKKHMGPKFHQLKFFHTIPMTLWRPFITPSMARLVYGYQLMNINHYEWTITINGNPHIMDIIYWISTYGLYVGKVKHVSPQTLLIMASWPAEKNIYPLVMTSSSLWKITIV